MRNTLENRGEGKDKTKQTFSMGAEINQGWIFSGPVLLDILTIRAAIL